MFKTQVAGIIILLLAFGIWFYNSVCLLSPDYCLNSFRTYVTSCKKCLVSKFNTYLCIMILMWLHILHASCAWQQSRLVYNTYPIFTVDYSFLGSFATRSYCRIIFHIAESYFLPSIETSPKSTFPFPITFVQLPFLRAFLHTIFIAFGRLMSWSLTRFEHTMLCSSFILICIRCYN